MASKGFWARGLSGGAGGGFVGAIFIMLILMGGFVAMGLPALAPFMTMGAFVAGPGPSVAALGLVAHYLEGIVDGLIFVAILGGLGSRFRVFRMTSGGKSLGLGVRYGILVWIIVFQPNL